MHDPQPHAGADRLGLRELELLVPVKAKSKAIAAARRPTPVLPRKAPAPAGQRRFRQINRLADLPLWIDEINGEARLPDGSAA